MEQISMTSTFITRMAHEVKAYVLNKQAATWEGLRDAVVTPA
jgi:hypothetical protein